MKTVQSEHVEFAPVCAEKQNTSEASASPCALKHCAFFNCITSVRLLSRAGYKLKHFESTLI